MGIQGTCQLIPVHLLEDVHVNPSTGSGQARQGMNTLIVNRETFQMPTDGWYQLAPLGEFAHAAAGVVQVVDSEACTAMAARFKADSAVENFAGLLVDFDHFSLDSGKRSEAAGWIVGLEYRGQRAEGGDLRPEAGKTGAEFEQKVAKEAKGDGLWANIRWSDLGEEAVKGGRYRFLSPVWARSDCIELGNGRVRPVRLLNAAVTNDPNLKGMCPLCNASTALSAGNGQEVRGQTEFEQKVAKEAKGGSIPVDSCACNRGCVDKPGFVPAAGATPRRPKGPERMAMKRVIEKLVNHLGIPGDATEDAILEKMQGLPGLTAVTDLQNSLKKAQEERDALKADLQNSVKQAQADRDALQGKLKGAEDELVNRHLAEFEGVISEATKPFWSEQLLKNRDAALAALGDVAKAKAEGGNLKPEEKTVGKEESTRKPLHNRATARPVIPSVGGANPSTGSGSSEGRAVKIRNRAHEIAKNEGVAFSTAFRRAEKEVCEE